jgi:hypothetical protein
MPQNGNIRAGLGLIFYLATDPVCAGEVASETLASIIPIVPWQFLLTKHPAKRPAQKTLPKNFTGDQMCIESVVRYT